MRFRAHQLFRRLLSAGILCATLLACISGIAQGKVERPNNVPGAREGAERGKALAAELRSRAPEPSLRTNTLRVENAAGQKRELKVKFETRPSSTNWVAVYEVLPGQRTTGRLVITNAAGVTNHCALEQGATQTLNGNDTMTPFADSDFWVADLALEFLFWPGQAVIKQEMRKGQACQVLESTNPNPKGAAYAKVVSWVDNDSGGIVHADAYDASGKIFKRFEPSELERVNGHMQVKEIRMSNRKTGSRSWVVFDLGE